MSVAAITTRTLCAFIKQVLYQNFSERNATPQTLHEIRVFAQTILYLPEDVQVFVDYLRETGDLRVGLSRDLDDGEIAILRAELELGRAAIADRARRTAARPEPVRLHTRFAGRLLREIDI